MGADSFADTMFGRTADDAFYAAITAARWENGNGGYTGTIAEKLSYKLRQLPPRWTIEKLLKLIHAISIARDEILWANEIEGDRRKRAAGAKMRDLTAQQLAFVEDCAHDYEDKWGPALAFELTGKAARECRVDQGYKGCKGSVWCFIGLASS